MNFSIQANPYALRYGAQRFSTAAQALRGRAYSIHEIPAELMHTNDGWSGAGGDAFYDKCVELQQDLLKASSVFDRTADVFLTFASKMEHVIELREQARHLEHSIWSMRIETPADEEHLQDMRRRVRDLHYAAEMEARAADQQASAAFQDLSNMDRLLHIYSLLSTATETVKPDAIDRFGTGLNRALKDGVKGVIEVFTEPVTTLRNFVQVALHPISALEATYDAVYESFYRDVRHGDAGSASEWFGYAFGIGLASAVGTKGLDKTSKVAKVADHVPHTKEHLPDLMGENAILDGPLYDGAAHTRGDGTFSLHNVRGYAGDPFDRQIEALLPRYDVTKDQFKEMKNRPLENPGGLSPAEQASVRSIRDSVSLTPDSIISKVIDLRTLEKYLDGIYKEIGGYVARAQDTSTLKTPLEIKTELRLDYNHPDSKYHDPTWSNEYLNPDGSFKEEPVAIIRFPAHNTENYSVPYEFDDVQRLAKQNPYTGTGFLGGDLVIPEFYMSRRKIALGTEIFIRDNDGNEKLLAVYEGDGVWRKLDTTR